ncbi:GDSL-type esterase/lipase family protein [Streptosporangium sp. NPDC003464]
MIVGDSISHGLEGDYTWRYRLSRNFDKHDFPVRFVGPGRGTSVLPPSRPGDRPAGSAGAACAACAAEAAEMACTACAAGAACTACAADPVHNGRYRPGIGFGGSRHHARWGRRLHEAKDDIRETVAAHAPGYLMVELGFNDLAWGVSGPDRLRADVETFVRRAREADPDIQFLIANVVHRTPLDSSPGLPDIITSYNEALPATLAAMSTARSRVVLVDLDGAYDPHNDAYDGLHPNSIGEFKIAKAFADAFSSAFAHGRVDFLDPIPRTADPLVISAPAGITATPHGSHIRVSWPHVFGASGYWLYWRDATVGQGFQRSPLPILADSVASPAQAGHIYEFMVSGARGSQETPATEIAAAVLDGRPALSLTGGQAGR